MANRQLSGKWVLVVGTGAADALPLPAEVTWATVEVCRALAREGHGLITGDWPGVDELAAQTYASELHSLGVPVEDSLKQIVANDEPYERLVKDGSVVRADTMFDANLSKLGLADFVVLLGGVGGTLKMFRASQLVKKPVLPIAGTKGDAEEAFKDSLSEWHERPIEGISPEEFSRLGKPIKAEEDARRVAADLMLMIEKIIGQANEPPEFGCAVLTPNEEKFDHVRTVITEALKLAGVKRVIIVPAVDYRELGPNLTENPIEKADLVIADISGRRPNVMYELGFAHALRKPVLRIVEKGEGEIPDEHTSDADFTYNLTQTASELTSELLNWVERHKITSTQARVV